jgi:hypothetical protein
VITTRLLRGLDPVNANAAAPRVDMSQIGAAQQAAYIKKITDGANVDVDEVYNQTQAGVLEDTGLDQPNDVPAGEQADPEPEPVDVSTISNMNGDDSIDIGPGDEATVGDEVVTPSPPVTPRTWWSKNGKYVIGGAIAAVLAAGVATAVVISRRKSRG